MRTEIRILFVSFAWLGLAVAGCGDSATKQAQKKLVGKWSGDLSAVTKEAFKGKANENPLAGALGQMLLDAAKPTMEFDFQAEGKAHFSASFMGQSMSQSATWHVVRVEGNVITLATKRDNDSKVTEHAITMVDDHTISLVPPAEARVSNPVTFKRVVPTAGK